MVELISKYESSRGQPKGTIQYPWVFENIINLVDTRGKTIGEIEEAILRIENPHKSCKQVSRYTIKKYLDMHVDLGHIEKRGIGKNQRISQYFRV